MKIYEALAKVFHTLDLGTCFALLGNANMHWAGKLSRLGRGLFIRQTRGRRRRHHLCPQFRQSGVCNDVWPGPNQVIINPSHRGAGARAIDPIRRRSAAQNGTTK